MSVGDSVVVLEPAAPEPSGDKCHNCGGANGTTEQCVYCSLFATEAQLADNATLVEQQGREMRRLQELVNRLKASKEAHAEGLDTSEAQLAAVTEQCTRQEHGFARRESALQGQLAAVFEVLGQLPSPDQLRTDKRLTMDAKAVLADLIELLTAPSPGAGEETLWNPPGCRSGRDGECNWSECPQLRDGEPAKSRRHCPRDVSYEDE